MFIGTLRNFKDDPAGARAGLQLLFRNVRHSLLIESLTVETESRERRDQYHHQELQGHPRNARIRRGRNVEQGYADFRYGGGNGKDFFYRLYGKGFTRGPENHPDGNFDDWRSSQTGFRIDWSPNRRDEFTFQGDV